MAPGAWVVALAGAAVPRCPHPGPGAALPELMTRTIPDVCFPDAPILASCRGGAGLDLGRRGHRLLFRPALS